MSDSADPQQTPSRKARAISGGLGGIVGAAILAYINKFPGDNWAKEIVPLFVPSVAILLNSFFLWANKTILDYIIDEVNDVIHSAKIAIDKFKIKRALKKGNLSEQRKLELNDELALIDNDILNKFVSKLKERVKGPPK